MQLGKILVITIIICVCGITGFKQSCFAHAHERMIVPGEAIISKSSKPLKSISRPPKSEEVSVRRLKETAATSNFETETLSAHAFKVRDKSRALRQPNAKNAKLGPIKYRRANIPCHRPRIKRKLKQCGPGCSCSANHTVYLRRTPNDEFLAYQWNLQDSANNWDINAPEAWDLTTGSKEVVIGVIDTGILVSHPDLAANIWTNPNEIAGNGIDDDNNGYIDDIHGIDAITNSGTLIDDHGHGTHVSGIIGADGNNSAGVAGVNWDVTLIGARFIDSSGSGTIADAIKCIDYITTLKSRKDLDIVATNNSYGFYFYNQALYDAVSRANEAGILFVAAAGNEANNNDSFPSYPDSFNLDNVISVAATGSDDAPNLSDSDADGSLAGFSNYGITNVDIAAPGSNIASTAIAPYFYEIYSGTSQAAPHVTGVVSLIKSVNRDLSASELKGILFSSARSLNSLTGLIANSRFLDAHAAVVAASNFTPAATRIPTPAQTPTPTPTLTATPTPTAIVGPTPANDQTYSLVITGPGGDGALIPAQAFTAQISIPTNTQAHLQAVIGRRVCSFSTYNGPVSSSNSNEPKAVTFMLAKDARKFSSITWTLTSDTGEEKATFSTPIARNGRQSKVKVRTAASRVCKVLKSAL